MKLKDKVAVVTGGSGGIGAAICRRYADEGARVVVADRNGDSAQRLAAEIGKGSLAVALDVASRASIDAMVEQVVATAGGIDILVNNAGITRDNLVMRLKDEDWDDVLNANLRGAFAAIRAVVRGMMKKRNGRIINMASVVGLNGNKGQANYAASKAGLIALTKSVAK